MRRSNLALLFVGIGWAGAAVGQPAGAPRTPKDAGQPGSGGRDGQRRIHLPNLLRDLPRRRRQGRRPARGQPALPPARPDAHREAQRRRVPDRQGDPYRGWAQSRQGARRPRHAGLGGRVPQCRDRLRRGGRQGQDPQRRRPLEDDPGAREVTRERCSPATRLAGHSWRTGRRGVLEDLGHLHVGDILEFAVVVAHGAEARVRPGQGLHLVRRASDERCRPSRLRPLGLCATEWWKRLRVARGGRKLCVATLQLTGPRAAAARQGVAPGLHSSPPGFWAASR